MPQPNRFANHSAASNSKPKWRNDQRCIHRICPQDESPLFRLPSELRANIWKRALPYSEDLSFLSSAESINEHTLTDTVDETNKQQAGQRIPLIENSNPIVTWRSGNLGLLRVCKRIEVEATRTFFASNAFECVIDGLNPCLAIQYGFSPDEAIARDPRRRRRGSGLRDLRTVPQKYCRLIPSWVLSFTTFCGLEFDLLHAGEAFFEALAKGTQSQEKEESRVRRKKHREQVLFGLDRWLRLSGACESARRPVNLLALRFYPEWDYDDFENPDPLLKTRVLKNIPQAVYSRRSK